MKRGWGFLVGLVAVIVLAGGTVAWYAAGPSELEQLSGRVTPGMTVAESHELLGQFQFHSASFVEGTRYFFRVEKWGDGNGGRVVVHFANGLVEKKVTYLEPFWDRLRARLGW